jgi:nitronate monooxygenase
MTPLQALLGIEIPVIQAPMAGAQGSALAAAVSNAGGLGSLPCAQLTLEAVRNELSALKRQTSKPFNVNFFCHAPPVADAAREAAWRTKLAPYYRALGLDIEAASGGPQRKPFGDAEAELLGEMRPAPAVVSFHFGLPSADLLTRIRALGSRVIASATTIEEARWLEARGVDAIIAQGLEAGGHRGMFLSDDLTTQMGTFALLPQIVSAVKTPVIAAGGIADSKGVAAAMALGAQAVQIGTAYLLCPESTTSPVHRAALKTQQAGHTALTNLYTGRPARGIVNRLMTELGAMSEVPAFPLAAAAIAPLRARAESAGSGDFSPLWAGQNACGCREVSAAALTRELAAGIATLAPPDSAC